MAASPSWLAVKELAVQDIIKDLTDRRGLRQAYESIDADIQREITLTWQALIEKHFPSLSVEGVPPAEIPYDQFKSVELRIGRVFEAERVPKSTKLLRMQVSFGTFNRQILAGIGETFDPILLIGKQFLFVVNLAPRKMMGFESHGMMLASGPESKNLQLFCPNSEAQEGAEVG